MLWFQERVDIIDFHNISARSVTKSFPIPSVLRLRKYISLHKKDEIKLNRNNLFLRDDQQCQYCLKHFQRSQLTIDHVMPISRGGPHKWTNVVTACAKCNNKKGSQTPEEFGKPLKKKPFKPKNLKYRKIPWMNDQFPEAWKPYLLAATG